MAFDESLLEHAERYWQAQCDNATRLTLRGNLTMAALGAMFGLGLYRIEWFRGFRDQLRFECAWAAYGVKIALIISLVLFAFSFILMIRSSRLRFAETWRAAFGNGKDDHQLYGRASDELRFTAEQIKTLTKKDEVSARVMVFARVYRAADDLRKRNILRAKHQHRANLVFSLGLTAVAVAIMLFILGSEPAIIH